MNLLGQQLIARSHYDRCGKFFCVAIAIHAVLLLHDIFSNFAAFLQGDRSYPRFQMMQSFLRADSAAYLNTLVHGTVMPSEYLFQLPFYLIGGISGVILAQTALTILSALCIARMAGMIFKKESSGIIAGMMYLLLPQNLVFAHQFVTEAIATPFCVYFLYFLLRHIQQLRRRDIICAGLCLGIAIFIRPSLVLFIPLFLTIALIFRAYTIAGFMKNVGIMSAISILPLTLWAVIFTVATGHVGYTDGVANLAWNLRSKVFVIQDANGIEKSEEVKKFVKYGDLYGDTGGITISRFLDIASSNPIPFIKTAFADAAIVLGKGNSTKLTVDYLGIARDSKIKDWRSIMESRGVLGLLIWGAQNTPMLLVFALEGFFSFLTILTIVTVILFAIRKATQSTKEYADARPIEFVLVVAMLSLVCTVILSSEIVDRAQARLRNPAEASIILVMGLVVSAARESKQALPKKTAI